MVKTGIEYINGHALRRINTVSVFSQILIAVALYGLCYHLFYMQSIQEGGIIRDFFSDLPLHISAGIKGESYSFLTRTAGIVAINFGNEGVAAFESGLIVLTWYFARLLIEKITGFRSVISIYAALALIFLTNIHLPVFDYYYKERFISQPWHNITYIGMRLFAVLAIFYFIDLYKNYRERILWKNYFCILLLLLLSAGSKPNFFISFSAALFIALVVDFVRDDRRIENLKKYFIIGSTVFPSCVVLFLQTRILYPSGVSGQSGETGIMLVWFSNFFEIGIGMGIIKLFVCLTFPAVVFLVNKGGDRAGRFIVLYFLVSFFIAYVFQESGARKNDGNFFWGIRCAGYILFLFAFSYFIKNWKEGVPEKKVASVIYKILCVILVIAHIYSGLTYFNIIRQGALYFI